MNNTTMRAGMMKPKLSLFAEEVRGHPPYPTVLMVKILMLQQLHNLADEAIDYQLLDRRSFLAFLGLTESNMIPDTKTIWLFLDRLAQVGLGAQLFEAVQQQLLTHGYLARRGQIIDASIVPAPTQRNKREEAETVKQGTMPVTWKAHKRVQKDVDAKWTKKHGKNHFGYKLHVSVDRRCKLICKLVVTDAVVADTTVFESILDSNNTNKDVYANRGYASAAREAALKQAGWRAHIHRKGSKQKLISATQKQRNRRIATPRARVEHVFGALRQMAENWPAACHRAYDAGITSQMRRLQLEASRVSERTENRSVLDDIWPNGRSLRCVIAHT